MGYIIDNSYITTFFDGLSNLVDRIPDILLLPGSQVLFQARIFSKRPRILTMKLMHVISVFLYF